MSAGEGPARCRALTGGAVVRERQSEEAAEAIAEAKVDTSE